MPHNKKNTEKSSKQFEGPPMSLAESKKNGLRLARIGICLWPTLLIIIGVIGILIAIKILISNTGYISTTEIVSLKWISQTSENIQSKNDIFYQLRNESSINKKRNKRMIPSLSNDTEKVEDIFSKYKDREILKAREIIANHKVECNDENKSEICKDLVLKLRNLRHTDNEKMFHLDASNPRSKYNKVDKGPVYSFDNVVSTDKSNRVKIPLRKYGANSVAETIARDPYANLYPSPSYTVNSYAPLPHPPQTPPLSETCLLARLLKDNQAHYKGLYNAPLEDYNSQYAQHTSAYNRYPPPPTLNQYPQLREVEAQAHKVHPQDIDILMRYLAPKQDSIDKATPKPSNATTREAQCPIGSVSCDNGDDCISESQWCDGNVDCSDVSDEARCSCKSRVDKSRLCDGYFDCPFGEDETGCNGCSENTFSCDDLDVNPRITCFTKEQRCNNIVDCPNQRDEFECNSLSPSLHRKPLFAISNTEGFLHRNFRGDWYPVCKNPYMWAHDACRRETGLIIRPPFIQLVSIDPMLKVTYLNTGPGGFMHTSDTCFNSSAVYVTCPDILCGTRMQSTSQLLRENTAIENTLFGRNKRFLLNRNPYEIFYGGRRRQHTNKSAIEKITSGPTKYNQESRENDFISEEKSNLEMRGKRAESRVVGGRPSQPAAWPWMVAMYRNGMFHCGGVIINQHWIMSAAHCVHEFWNHYYEIQVGMLRRFSFSPQEQNHPISHIIVNHKYSKADMKNDLSLLKVKEEIQFSRWVRPICLPGPDTAGADWLWGPPTGSMCTAVGWGATVEHGPDPDHMREVELPIWSECKHKEDREGNEICAGPIEGGKDACQGDSGGPLLCKNPFNSQQWYVAGIVSHGDGCARKEEPGVYTRVSLFVKWIKHHISSSSLPKIQPKQICPGFKCKSGLFKCLPDKRVCDKIVDCLDGEDERKCNDLRSFNNIFMSRANNDTKEYQEAKHLRTTSIEHQSKLDNTKIVNDFERTANQLEDDLKHASTIEISISKSSEFESKSTESDSISTENDSSSEPITDRSILSRESKKDPNPNEDIIFAVTSSREALESMSSVLENQSSNPERGDLKEVDLEEDGFTTNTQIIDFSTSITDETTTHGVELTTDTSTTIMTTPFADSLDVNATENINKIMNTSLDEVESKSLLIELLPSSLPIHEVDNNLHVNDLDKTNNKEIKSITPDKSNKLSTFNNKSEITHKIEDIVFSELYPAKIRKKHLIPTEFECRQISQVIPYKYRCDHKADCEDGTDELDCTCTDYLSTFEDNLLCDGVFDCADGQDEIDCYSCPEDKFLCTKSQQCIPSKHVCDGEPQCPHKEDELDCFALSNGIELAYEFDGKPKINVEGFLTKKYKNDWHVVCEDTLSTKQQEEAATHICRYLGFSSANRYMVKNINLRNDKLLESNSKTKRNVPNVPVHFAYRTEIGEQDHARHIVIKDPQILKEECVPNVTKTCMSLYVKCDRPLFDNDIFTELFRREANSITDRPWPWIAKVYVEGEYKCSGVLLDTKLVLVGQSCLWDLLLEQHTVVVLGSYRTVNTTRGPYEQVLKVESKTELFNSKAILLHLKEPAVITSMVKPMAVTSSNVPDKNSICVAVGQDEKNATISMFLREMRENCSIHNVCFESVMKNKLCQQGVSSHRLWAGIISCHNEDGWYPAASFVDSRGECGVGDQIVATEIVHLRSSIRSADKKMLETKKEDTSCGGVRCGRGRCINLLQVCNGVNDCEDGNDESALACEKKTDICLKDPHQSGCECSSNQLRCHNGNCISKELFNNGHDDCGDKTDEPDHLSCSTYLARVMPSGLCNGVLNCEDRSDEDPMFCKCFAEKTYQCGKTSNVNHCVAPDVVCDGVRDCPNGEDESTCIALNAPYGTPSGSGQVIMRSHGIWHTKCYPTQNHTRAELEAICRELGFLSGHAKEVKALAKTIPPIYNAVLLDPFSDVRLNNMTRIKLRNTQEPMAKGYFDNSLENCHPVYIECL